MTSLKLSLYLEASNVRWYFFISFLWLFQFFSEDTLFISDKDPLQLAQTCSLLASTHWSPVFTWRKRVSMCCYDLNVCISHSLSSYVEALTLNVMVFGGRAVGK